MAKECKTTFTLSNTEQPPRHTKSDRPSEQAQTISFHLMPPSARFRLLLWLTETEIKIVNGAAPLASKKDRGERAKEEKRRKQRGKKKKAEGKKEMACVAKICAYREKESEKQRQRKRRLVHCSAWWRDKVMQLCSSWAPSDCACIKRLIDWCFDIVIDFARPLSFTRVPAAFCLVQRREAHFPVIMEQPSRHQTASTAAAAASSV